MERFDDSREVQASAVLREPLLEDNHHHNHHPEQDDDDNNDAEQHYNQQQRLWDGMPSRGTSILLKSLYFLQALGAAAWGRFGTIYYNNHALNSQQIGLLEGCMPFVGTVSQPFWGMIADHFHCRKAVYLFTNAAGTIALLALALPAVYATFTRIMTVSVLSMMFSSAGILDAYTLDMLGTENKLLYGRYRMWSSISWGLGAVLMGYITDHYGFEPNFIIYAALAVLTMFLIAGWIPEPDDKEVSSDRDDTGKLCDLVRLMVRPRVVIFLLEIVIMGAGMATVERLLFLYLVNDLGSSTLLCGLSVGVNVLFELPIFWYAEPLTAVLGGHDGMIALSLLCFVVRVFGYTLLTPDTVWYVLPLEAMHGVTFACFWVTMTDVAKVLIHEVVGWNTTIPTLVQTLYSALGTGLGSIIGGWAMHRYGARAMYRAAAGILFCTLLLHMVGSVTCRLVSQSSLLPNYCDVSSSSSTDREEDEAEQQQQQQETNEERGSSEKDTEVPQVEVEQVATDVGR